jgi:hypothetical protein
MDHHFLVRYSFTGVIFLVFALGGLWVINDDAAVRVMGTFSGSNMQVGPAVISAVATVPVIGVMIHGLYLIFGYLMWGHSFPDEARKQVAEVIREKANALTALDQQWKDHFTTNEASPKFLPDDSLFVWLYYFDAPPHLIEWARRRRDYFYLGVSWAMAAGIGLFLGMLAGRLVFHHLNVTVHWAPQPKCGYAVAILIFCALWIVAASWLGWLMKKDVDAMELAWAAARLNADLHKALPPKTFDGMNVSLNGEVVNNALSTGLRDLTTALSDGLPRVGDSIADNMRSLSGPFKNYLELQSGPVRVRLDEMSAKIQSLEEHVKNGFAEFNRKESEGRDGGTMEHGRAAE